jgi:hypothetical protein
MESSALLQFFTRRALKDCTEVGPGCPVKGTIYGYAPSLAWNALFLGVFLLSALIHAGQGIYYRMWTFLIAMVVGGVCEVAGKLHSIRSGFITISLVQRYPSRRSTINIY